MTAVQGRLVVLTGASSGVGLATARALAAMGARIVMVCRDGGRGAKAWAEIAAAATAAPPKLLLADLSSQDQVRALAGEIRRHEDRIDVLINNAGGIFARRELSDDGIERTLATNHLGPFFLTQLLLDLVRAAPAGRIVNVAAEAYPSRLDFDNLQGERRYGFLSAYFRSKLANILFTFELARRLEGSGIAVNCCSPGPTRTGFGDDLTGLPRLFPLLAKRFFQSPENGARTIVNLAAAPELAGVSGRFFLKGRARRTKKVTRDAAVAARIWRVSAALVGLPFDGLVAMAPRRVRDLAGAEIESLPSPMPVP